MVYAADYTLILLKVILSESSVLKRQYQAPLSINWASRIVVGPGTLFLESLVSYKRTMSKGLSTSQPSLSLSTAKITQHPLLESSKVFTAICFSTLSSLY
ncbi:42889_t:CDS:2 [Gigaspora margarita]|uniref:42889_t:CDS:1 n=1 Tax=Gigaspora margarita TaxID=4874 RepID=A0ABN7VEA4_GIGMA|nr:42889_t:CDS:2 [Gigaspora margarita]